MKRRVTTLLTTLASTAVVLSTIWAKPAIHYVWNASESAPVGLYRLQPTGRLFVTILVAIEPPEPLATFLAEGRYLPRGIPMLKHVLALPGQTVCRDNLAITVDKTWVGEARELDSRGRPLPIWQGCRVVADGEVFLMNWQSADSLDGRYFGALPTTAIIGRAEPLWTNEGGLTMSPARKPAVIPLFDQNTGPSFVPAKVRTAATRSGGPGRPSGRCVSASPLTAASTMAALRSLGTIVCFLAIFASSMLLSGAARAEGALSITQQAPTAPPGTFAAFVREASKRFAVPEHWIRAVMRVESGGKLRARSRKGAMGLMQIMPQTWTELRARYGLGTDPYDPHDNILAGAAYIRQLHDRYGAPGFLAAYNAGPGRYENHLATGRLLPDETQTYVATLAPMIGGEQISRKIVAVAKSLPLGRSRLFVVRIASNSSDDRPSPGMRPDHPPRVRAVVDLSALVPQSGNLFVRRAGEARSQ